MGEAIRHNNKGEWEWALGWVKARLPIVTRKDHLKTWKKREKQILEALSEFES